MKRTLVFSAEIAEAAAALAEGESRGDELLAGAKWVLERSAESGARVWQDPPIYVLSAQAGPRGPALSVFYTLSYDQVLVLSLGAKNALPAGIAQTARPAAIGPGGDGY